MDYSIPEILRVPLEELCLHIMVDRQASSLYHMWEIFFKPLLSFLLAEMSVWVP